MRALVTVPFVLPTVVVALAFLAILPAGLERGWAAILIAHAFFNVAVVVRVVGGVLGGPRPARLRSGGDARRGPVAAASRDHASAARARAGGGGRDRLPLLVHVVRDRPHPRRAGVLDSRDGDLHQAVRIFDLRAAAILSLVQLACVAVAVWVATRLEARLAVGGHAAARAGRASPPARPRARGSWWRGASAALGALPRRAARGARRALARRRGRTRARGVPRARRADRRAARDAVGGGRELDPLRDRRDRASRSSSAASRRSRSRSRAARGSLLDALLMLPLGASAVMLGFGFVIAFDTAPSTSARRRGSSRSRRRSSPFPFVVRIVAPTLRAIDDAPARGGGAARGLAAGVCAARSTFRSRDVRSAVAAGFAFAISLGEFGATVFLARPDSPTLPVAIFRFLGRPGELNAGQAYALAVILMVVVAVSVFLVERGRREHRLGGSDAADRGRVGAVRRRRRRWTASTLEVAEGEVVARARAERLRQEHAPARRSPGSSGRTPGGCCSTGATSRRSRRTAAGSGSCSRTTRSSTHRDVFGNVAFGLRMRGDARRGRRARAFASCSSSSGSPGSSTARSRRSRAASSSGSRSPARWRRRRASCSSTSRSARSTGGSATGCSTISRSCSTRSSVTALYVTHDQAEAFALGDRVAVMRAGRIVQDRHAGRALGSPGGCGRCALPRARATSATARSSGPRRFASSRPTARRRRRRRAPSGRGPSCA